MSIPIIHLIEDAPFLSLIRKTSVRYFRSTLGVSLIRDFSGNHNNELKFVVHFLPFLTLFWFFEYSSETVRSS